MCASVIIGSSLRIHNNLYKGLKDINPDYNGKREKAGEENKNESKKQGKQEQADEAKVNSEKKEGYFCAWRHGWRKRYMTSRRIS